MFRSFLLCRVEHTPVLVVAALLLRSTLADSGGHHRPTDTRCLHCQLGITTGAAPVLIVCGEEGDVRLGDNSSA